MHLIRDVLDNQLIRKDGYRLGKADGLVIELREGAPPRLAFIETGSDVLARRMGPRMGAWWSWLRRRWLGGRGAMRVPWSAVRDVGVDIEIADDHTAAAALHEWLLAHVMGRIPGGRQ